ncbi:hypothetical protein BRC89_13565 [Halobacteriales archaeon QS_4_70_19]|nr:MAG: hypothetical protein BRC89_13565 [Halobacteriales archaeon QS_4_70_19]
MASNHASGGVRPLPEEVAGWTVAALGLVLTGLGPVYYATAPDPEAFVTVVASLPGVMTTGLWLVANRQWVGTDQQPRLLRWTLLGGGVLGGLALAVVFVQGGSILGWLPLLQFVGGVGTTAGVAVGTSEARSIEAARRAERARVSAEHVREERDRLRFLNNLLRHNVLNKVNIVRAYTRDVAERQDGEFDTELETALAQTDDIAELVENVRHLVRATTDDRTRRPVDLRAAVQAGVDSVDVDSRGTVETDIPEVEVAGDDLLKYVVANLVRNGLEHHDRETATVRVGAAVEGETVTLRVADDGPGIPDERKEEVLRPGERGDSGLGLHLVSTVVKGYGGSVDIRDNDPQGTVVALTLPRA